MFKLSEIKVYLWGRLLVDGAICTCAIQFILVLIPSAAFECVEMCYRCHLYTGAQAHTDTHKLINSHIGILSQSHRSISGLTEWLNKLIKQRLHYP